ncbi:MAG: hypothetical protein R3C56_35580 [Pirellulaceae bacterium]
MATRASVRDGKHVAPLDAGYATLSEQGETLSVAAGVEFVADQYLHGRAAHQNQKFLQATSRRCEAVAQFGDSIYATRMKPTAPRTAQDTPTRYTFVNNDYNSERPVVTARAVSKLDGSGAMLWSYEGQGSSRGSLAVDEERQRMIFVERRSTACIDHATDPILATIMEDAQLVCLNTETGAIA